MNIFRREVKANLRSLLIWGFIVALFISMGFSEFSAYEGNPEMLEILDSLPPAMLAAFNMEAFNLTTVTGFFGIMYAYFALLLSISAVMWGSDIISKEERDKTVEFSLTLPVSRSKLITAKTLAALVNCFGLLLITVLVILANVSIYQPDSAFYNFMFLVVVSLFILQMIFLAIGIFLGCAMKQHKRAGSVAVSLLLVTYFVSVIASMNEDLSFLEYFSPFSYFDPVMLLHESRFEGVFLLLSAGIIVASMVGAYVTYSKRDLYI